MPRKKNESDSEDLNNPFLYFSEEDEEKIKKKQSKQNLQAETKEERKNLIDLFKQGFKQED